MEFSKFPFGVPKSVKDSSTINSILAVSFALQRRHRLSNAGGLVNIVLHKCLHSAKINSDLVYGYLVSEGADLTLPHVWLEIEGHIVDNTYVEDIPLPIFIELKKSAKYRKSLAGYEMSNIYLGDEVTAERGIDNHDVKAFQWMFKNENKTVLLSQNKPEMKEYYRSMSLYLAENMDSAYLVIPENVSCWKCDAKTDSLKKCGKCRVAKYCGKECQQQDWKDIHGSLCLPREPRA